MGPAGRGVSKPAKLGMHASGVAPRGLPGCRLVPACMWRGLAKASAGRRFGATEKPHAQPRGALEGRARAPGMGRRRLQAVHACTRGCARSNECGGHKGRAMRRGGPAAVGRRVTQRVRQGRGIAFEPLSTGFAAVGPLHSMSAPPCAVARACGRTGGRESAAARFGGHAQQTPCSLCEIARCMCRCGRWSGPRSGSWGHLLAAQSGRTASRQGIRAVHAVVAGVRWQPPLEAVEAVAARVATWAPWRRAEQRRAYAAQPMRAGAQH